MPDLRSDAKQSVARRERRTPPPKPTKAELAAAIHKTLPDVIAPDLRIVFCGINPGLYTAAIGHHYGRPGNRFWPALHGAGFTPRLLSPWDEAELLPLGYGLTNVVARTTATAAEVRAEEFVEGGRRLARLAQCYRPRVIACLGIGAYRIAFAQPQATLGLQPHQLSESRLWLLPSPSGLNANHQLSDLVALMTELRAFVEREMEPSAG